MSDTSDQEWKMRVINALSETDYEIVVPFLAEAEAAVNWRAERTEVVTAIHTQIMQIKGLGYAQLIELKTLLWVLHLLGETS